VSQALTLGFGQTTISSFKGSGVTHDFRAAMPAGSTYTRVGAATALTAAGIIQTFADNAPQRTDRGLALEPAATNLLVRSQEFDNASWVNTNATVTANAAVAPDGTTTADALIADLVDGQHRNNQTPTSSAGTQTLSVFGRPLSYKFVTLRIGTAGGGVIFNTETGAIVGSEGGTTPSIVAAANSFYRCAVAITGNAANAIARINTSPTTNITFAGDGTSGAYLWQAQLELGSVATSPIVTTGTTASRSLPVFTEAVPIGCSKAVLTYYDGTTSEATGLTPGDTFEYAEHVIAAGKGRFGVSELVSRRWAA
jgi:hypothetical protein